LSIIIRKLFNWIIARATFKLYNSSSPIGRRLGGHDIPKVIDQYIILEIGIAGVLSFTGYFQTS
jgi:hypothetical protein